MDLPDRIALNNASRAPSDLNFWSTCQCRDRQPVVSHTAATESHHLRILSKSTALPMHISAIPVSLSDAGVKGSAVTMIHIVRMVYYFCNLWGMQGCSFGRRGRVVCLMKGGIIISGINGGFCSYLRSIRFYRTCRWSISSSNSKIRFVRYW